MGIGCCGPREGCFDLEPLEQKTPIITCRGPREGQQQRSAACGGYSELLLVQRSNFHKGAVRPSGKIG